MKLSEGEKHILLNQYRMMQWMVYAEPDKRFKTSMLMCSDIGRTEAILELAGVEFK